MSDARSARQSRVLFVDDEQRVLDGLRRMLFSLRSQWDMVFVASPQEALRLVGEQPFDVVVSDMRMPVMNGAELLRRVSQICPSSVRILLSGEAEVSAITKAVGPSHRYLGKPCDPVALKNAVSEAFVLREHLANVRLREIVGGIESLPPLPSIYAELMAAIDRGASCQEIAEIVSRDIAASLEILKLVNSGFFGGGRTTSDPVRAVMTLGTDTVQAVVLGAGLFEQLKEGAERELTALWETSKRAAVFARRICANEKLDEVFTSQATLGSLVHDVGCLVLRRHAPELLDEARALAEGESLPEEDAELRAIGATHGDVGAHLLRLWGFPDGLLEAVAFHHLPSRAPCRELAPVSVVHAAQAFAHSREPQLDLAHFEAAGCAERLERWAELCAESADE